MEAYRIVLKLKLFLIFYRLDSLIIQTESLDCKIEIGFLIENRNQIESPP